MAFVQQMKDQARQLQAMQAQAMQQAAALRQAAGGTVAVTVTGGGGRPARGPGAAAGPMSWARQVMAPAGPRQDPATPSAAPV